MRNVEKYRNNSIELLKDNDLYEAPVDLKKLANKLNIDVRYVEFSDETSGKIKYNYSDDNVVISINKLEFEPRQRFSLAHELGHYIYDIDFENNTEIQDTEQTLFRKDVVNPIEKRANKYAEKLLMPKELFIAEVDRIKKEMFPNLDNKLGVQRIYQIIENVADKFQVSKPAAIMRLASVGKISPIMKRKLFGFHY